VHYAILDSLENIVTNVYAKFDDDRLWNEKALVRTNKNKNNVGSGWGPVSGSKNVVFLCVMNTVGRAESASSTISWRRPPLGFSSVSVQVTWSPVTSASATWLRIIISRTCTQVRRHHGSWRHTIIQQDWRRPIRHRCLYRLTGPLASTQLISQTSVNNSCYFRSYDALGQARNTLPQSYPHGI